MNKTLFFLLFSTFFVNTAFADPNFMPIPIEKPQNKAKYYIGKKLFFDKNLSKDKTVSCATCHIHKKGGADNKKVSIGVYGRTGHFNTPTFFNAKYNISQDWKGEYKTIKKRSIEAFLNKQEMLGDEKETIKYIISSKDFYAQFITVYKNVTLDTIFDAISYYVKYQTTPNSKFDKYLRGETQLSKEEMEGYELFKTYGCSSCHNGINIGGNMFQKSGIFYEDELKRDHNLGRYEITKKTYDKYVYKVPSLRNITKTAPYTHDGEIQNLQTMIKTMARYQLGIEINQEEVIKIEKFLETLTGEIPNE